MRHVEQGIRTAACRQGLYRLFGAAALLAAANAGAAAQAPFVPNNIATSTVPANGDVNPYGVAYVPSNSPLRRDNRAVRHPGFELQQQEQPARHRHDDH